MISNIQKLKHNTLFGIIFGGIIFGICGVYAGYLYNSEDVSYDGTKTDKTNVKDALDELYSGINKYELVYTNIVDVSSTTFSSNISTNLNAGNYLIVASGKSVEYGPRFLISNCDELNDPGDYVNFSNWTQGYSAGRGGGLSKLYICKLKMQKTITLGCANSNGNYFTTCGFGIYK